MFRFPLYRFSIQNSYQTYAQKIKAKEDVVQLEKVLQKAFQINKQLKQQTDKAAKMQDGAIYKFYTPFRTILAAYQQQKSSDQLNQELIGNSIEALSKTYKAYSKLDTFHFDIDPTKLEQSLEYETLYKQGLKLSDFKAMAQFVQAMTDLGSFQDNEFIINKSFDLINNRDFRISQIPQFQLFIQQIFDEETQEVKSVDEYDSIFEEFNNYIKTTSDNFLKIIHAIQELKSNYKRIVDIQDREFLKEAVLLNLDMLELEEALLELNIISPQDVLKQDENPQLDDAINFILDGKQNQKELFEKLVNIKVNKLVVNQKFIDKEQDTSELVVALTNLANRSVERIFDQNYIKIRGMLVTLFDLLNKKQNQNWLNLFYAYSKSGLDQQAQQFLQKVDQKNLSQDEKIRLIDGLIEINLSSQIGDLTQNIEITHLNNDQLAIFALAQTLQGIFSDLTKFELEHRYLNIQAQNDLSYHTLYLLQDLAFIFNNESILPFKLKIEESEVFQQILKVFPKSFSIIDKGLYPQIMGKVYLVNSNFCLSNGKLNGYAQNRVNILRCKYLTVNQFVGVQQEQIKELLAKTFDISEQQKDLFVKLQEILNSVEAELKSDKSENFVEIDFSNINKLNLELCIKKARATLNNYYNTNFENQKNYLGQLLRAQLLELEHRASSVGLQLNLKQLINQIPIKQYTIPKWFGLHQSQQLIQVNDSLDGFKASLLDESFLFGEYCPYEDVRERLSNQGVIVRQASNVIYRNAINIPNHKEVRRQIISSYPLGWREHAKYQDEQSQKEIDELYEFLALQQKQSNIDRNDLFAINLLNLKAELKLRPLTQIVDWVFSLDVWDQLLESKLTSINQKVHGTYLQRSPSSFLKAQLAKKHKSQTVDFLEHTSQQNEAIDNLITYRQEILNQMYEDVRNKKLNKEEAQTVARKVDEIFTKKVQDFKNQFRQHHSSPYFQKRVNYLEIQMTKEDINQLKVNEYPESQDPDLLVVNQKQWLTVKRSRAEDKLLTYRILVKQQKGEKITDKEKQFLNKLSLYEPQVSVTHFKIQDLSQNDKQKLQSFVHSQLQEFPDYTLSDIILELSDIFDNQLFREILTKKFYNSNGLQYQIQRTASNLALRIREEQIYKDQRSLNQEQLQDLKQIVEIASINTWPDKNEREINNANNNQIITKLNQSEGQLESIYGWLSAKYDEQKIDVSLARGDDIQIWNAVFTIPYQKASSKDLHEIVEQLLQRFYICKYHAPPIFRRVIMLILTHPQTSELDKQVTIKLQTKSQLLVIPSIYNYQFLSIPLMCQILQNLINNYQNILMICIIHMEKNYGNEYIKMSKLSNQQQAEILGQSVVICRSIVIELLKHSRNQLIENYIQTQIPTYSTQFIISLSQEILEFGISQADEFQVQFDEDYEPISKIDDGWRSYIANVDIRLPPPSLPTQPHSVTRNSLHEFRKSIVKIESKKSVLFDEYQSDFVYMGKTQEDDPFENGLRQQHEREQQLRQLKLLSQQQRLQEQKEQQKQIKMISSNLLGNKAYTYDFEGKLMVQNYPKFEQFQPTQQKLNPEVKMIDKHVLIDFGKSFAKHSVKQNTKDLRRDSSQLQFLPKFEQNLLESIQAAKGVTIFDGKSQLQGPKFQNSLLLKNKEIMAEQLQNNNALQMTKSEYAEIAQTKIKQSPGVDETINFSNRLPITEQSRRKMNSSYDGQSLLAGSIKYNNDSNVSIDELIIQEEEIKPLPQIVKYPSYSDKKDNLLKYKIDFSNGKPKLPKVYATNKSLPHLPKNPRERVFSQVLLAVNQRN